MDGNLAVSCLTYRVCFWFSFSRVLSCSRCSVKNKPPSLHPAFYTQPVVFLSIGGQSSVLLAPLTILLTLHSLQNQRSFCSVSGSNMWGPHLTLLKCMWFFFWTMHILKHYLFIIKYLFKRFCYDSLLFCCKQEAEPDCWSSYVNYIVTLYRWTLACATDTHAL